jgi:hypothetical protein
MNQESEFPFEKARRVTPAENQEFRATLVEQFGIDLKKRGNVKIVGWVERGRNPTIALKDLSRPESIEYF